MPDEAIRDVLASAGTPEAAAAQPAARSITDELLVKAAHRSTLDELTDWTLWADKVITF